MYGYYIAFLMYANEYMAKHFGYTHTYVCMPVALRNFIKQRLNLVLRTCRKVTNYKHIKMASLQELER